MRKLILVTGGARSGKSAYTESLAALNGENILYVATSIPFDEEMKDRIRKHRLQRPSCWETLEAYKGLDTCLPERCRGKDAVMIDCITIMVSNLMFEEQTDWDNITPETANRLEEKVKAEIDKLIKAAMNVDIPVYAVTNELGMGLVPENPLGRIFRDIAGRVNQALAKAADEVYFCVSGIPIRIK